LEERVALREEEEGKGRGKRKRRGKRSKGENVTTKNKLCNYIEVNKTTKI
jgi:hypothetical protein